jgi:pyruvate/2-oxoacid:ferredoxin oxidoreductase alpha subunit
MTKPPASRTWARDLLGAIGLVEGAVAQRVFSAVEGLALPSHNVFGDPLAIERGADVAALTRRCADAAARGERVALVARAADLTVARGELAEIAASRLGVVVHAVAGPAPWGTPASQGGIAPALALDDLPWGMLLGAGVAEVLDLALVARRAAEDSGCPFFVVHESSHAHHVETVSVPSRELCESFVGSGRARGPAPAGSLPPASDSDRAFAQRVPFALGSAMRELEGLTGRRHDVIERVPAADASVAFVGAGAVGDSLVADVERLRAAGHDVGAVRLMAWRPFPAARLVKALGRALVVSVLERVDQPLASNPPLAGQLKAAFADAITWAPDYPGVGRIPRIVSGVVAPHREVDSSDLDALMHNVLADERGKRTFVLGGDDAHSISAPPVERIPGGVFALRGITSRREVAIAAAELSSAVLTSAFGARVRVAVRALSAEEGGGVAFDLLAGRERPRGLHAPHAVNVVVVDDEALLARGNPFARLAAGGCLVLPTRQRAADAFWAEVPGWARAIAFDRGGRVLGWSPAPAGHDAWDGAAAFVGVALAVASGHPALVGAGPGGAGGAPIDAAVVEREVAGALRVALEASGPDASLTGGRGSAASALAIDEAERRGVRLASEAFAAYIEVPRATIGREDEAIRLGRRESRSPAAPAAPASPAEAQPSERPR